MNTVNNLISLKAATLADWLIVSFQVQAGYGLAKYLKIASCFDNHTAIGLWVENAMHTWPTEKRTTLQLKKAFMDKVPLNFHSS